jgi:hypothetical protein
MKISSEFGAVCDPPVSGPRNSSGCDACMGWGVLFYRRPDKGDYRYVIICPTCKNRRIVEEKKKPRRTWVSNDDSD